MKTETFHLEFITPCFSGGAESSRAELRPAEIRGQLRWWFRHLGGTPDQERAVFGGVHGDNPTASTLIVRGRVIPETGQRDWFDNTKIPRSGVGNRTYLLGFFCGRTNRLQTSGALPPQSKAEITLIFRRPPTPKLEQAIRVFFSIGAMGFRATRTAGAFFTQEHALTADSWARLAEELHRAGFRTALLPNTFANWVAVCEAAGALLKQKLRGELGISAGKNGTSPNALGSATPRQASVVHLRPVMIDQKIRLALLEAPHQRILGPEARRAHGARGSIIQLAHLH
jgi:CRISPR type III-B/RAMP module RAMP protein Cmr1